MRRYPAGGGAAGCPSSKNPGNDDRPISSSSWWTTWVSRTLDRTAGEISTPHLDRLAAEGMRFTQFYNTSKCFPTRASLMTGLYAHQVGMGERIDTLRNGVTIAEVLREAGYRTYMTGKWHGLENPFDGGSTAITGSWTAPSTISIPGSSGPASRRLQEKARDMCAPGLSMARYFDRTPRTTRIFTRRTPTRKKPSTT